MNNGMQAIMDAILQGQMKPKQLEVDEMYNQKDPQKQEMMDMNTQLASMLDDIQFADSKKKGGSPYGSLAGA